MLQTKARIMAQNIIQIPVAFEFRTTPAKWEAVPVGITGWWRRDDGTVDSRHLKAAVRTSFGVRSFKFPLASLPEEQEELCTDAFLESESSDNRVYEICYSFRRMLLVCSGKTNVTDSYLTKHGSPADAWQLRGEFLRTTLDYAGAVAFLNGWGPWSYADYVELSDLVRLQKSVREALTGSAAKWLKSSESFPSLWRRIPEYPYFALRTNICRDAIRMTVTIDLLKKLKFKTCARRDCDLPFPIQSKHKRKYCTQYCAHLESVRRNRKPKSLQLKLVRGAADMLSTSAVKSTGTNSPSTVRRYGN